MSSTSKPLRKADLPDLHSWAEEVCENASGWAERTELSRGELKQLTAHLDAIASKARHIANLTFILKNRK